MIKWSILAGATVIGLSALVAQASAKSLQDLISAGAVNIGVNLDAPPYGSIDDKQNPIGFDVDVAKLLGSYLGVKVNIVQTQGPTRIPMLLTNKIDLVVADLGITAARAKQLLFSEPYGTLDGYILANKNKKIATVDDLAGLKIGVPRAGTFDTEVTTLLGGKISAQIVRFDDDATVFQALLSGQVDAIGENESIFDNLMKARPSLPFEKKFAIGHQFDGVGIRPGEYDVLQWVNTALFVARANGDLEKITQKWLSEPLPPFLRVPQ